MFCRGLQFSKRGLGVFFFLNWCRKAWAGKGGDFHMGLCFLFLPVQNRSLMHWWAFELWSVFLLLSPCLYTLYLQIPYLHIIFSWAFPPRRLASLLSKQDQGRSCRRLVRPRARSGRCERRAEVRRGHQLKSCSCGVYWGGLPWVFGSLRMPFFVVLSFVGQNW